MQGKAHAHANYLAQPYITPANHLHGKDTEKCLLKDKCLYCDYGWTLSLDSSWDSIWCLCWACSGQLFIMSCKHIFLQYGPHWKWAWHDCELSSFCFTLQKLYLYSGKTELFPIIHVATADSIGWSCHFHESLDRDWLKINSQSRFSSLIYVCNVSVGLWTTQIWDEKWTISWNQKISSRKVAQYI